MRYRLHTPILTRGNSLLEPARMPTVCPDCGSTQLHMMFVDGRYPVGGNYVACPTQGCGYVWYVGQMPTEAFLDDLLDRESGDDDDEMEK